MLEALEYYQSLAQRFPGQLLTGLGVMVVLAGLCIWLAGLRWRKVIGAFAGVVVAAAGVFIIGRCAGGVLLAVCVIGLVAGVIINRIVFGIFGAAVSVFVIMLILAGGSTAAEITADNFYLEYSYPTWPEYEQSNIVIDAPTALQITTQMAEYFVDRAKGAAVSSPVKSFVGAGLAAMITVAIALAAPRIFIAVVSSALGSAVIFAGMIMLLFYKGSRPVSYIAQKPWFYTAAFAAMIILGTAVQLILSPPPAKQIKVDLPEEKSEIKNRFRTL